jgi:phospholipid transport system substrate-binding protein
MEEWNMKAVNRLVWVLVACLWGTNGYAEEVGPKELIATNYAKIEAVIATEKPVEGMREDIKGQMESFVDYRELARLTVKKKWEEFSSAEQTEFVGLVKGLIQRNYAKRFKPDTSLKVTYNGEPAFRKGKAKLSTTVSSGDVTADVDYKMHKPEGKTEWWVYDIVIDEVSMMRNYRTQFGKIWKKGGKTALFEKLRKNEVKE